MIIVLFGQPACGKTTLAKKIAENDFIHIDGDDLRDIFKNKDYSREGRIKNLNRASDIAKYLSYKGSNVVLSLVYPYEEARKYFDSDGNKSTNKFKFTCSHAILEYNSGQTHIWK